MSNEHLFHVLIKQEESVWIAQCLEFDLVAQAERKEDLEIRFAMVIAGHLEMACRNGSKPFEGIPPAPQEVRDEFWAQAEANGLICRRLPIEVKRQGSETLTLRLESAKKAA